MQSETHNLNISYDICYLNEKCTALRSRIKIFSPTKMQVNSQHHLSILSLNKTLIYLFTQIYILL